jgi:hypothetical protein
MRHVIQDNAERVLSDPQAMLAICPYLGEDERRSDGIDNQALVYADNVAWKIERR